MSGTKLDTSPCNLAISLIMLEEMNSYCSAGVRKTVSMSGFSNAYRVSKDAQGQNIFEEKVIVQKFERPGDEFLQEEIEFRLVDQADTDGDGKADVRYPLWQYRPRQFATQIPNLDQILRNISTSAPAASQ